MHDSIIRLLEYLAALSKLSSKTVFSLDEYERVFWLHSLPRESLLCFCRAWKTEEHGDDIWLTLKKAPPRTAAPSPPDNCALWLRQDALADCNKPPELEQSVVLDCSEDDATRTLHLKDVPAVREQWLSYLAEQWQPWAEECRQHEAVRQAYTELFLLHQKLQKSGEQWELVLGLGLLRWQNSSGREIKRHVAVAGISLVFDAEKGLFTVRQDSDKAEIELDMLDEQPLDARSLIDEGRTAVSAAVHDRSKLDAVLRTIAHSLGTAGQGEYHPDRMEPAPQPSKDKPLLEYAPALILRKRCQRGLDQLLTEWKAQPDDVLSDGFRQLCGIPPKEKCQKDKPAPLSGELYFPLPANEEQRKIIRTLDMQAGVLVQGPPGTGKSHTIANLISHLLATGKRILVTAKNKQALQVLHGKLPKELRPLAISLLGDEKSSLAQSVEGIISKWNLWDETENSRRVGELEARLHGNRKARAAAEQQIRALREQETFTHQLADGHYSGTAAQIARQLRDADKHAWLADFIPLDAPLPLTAKETDFLRQYFAAVSPIDEEELSLQLPAPEQLLPVIKVEAAFQKEIMAKEQAEPGNERLQRGTGAALLQTDKESVRFLHQQAQDMAAAFRNLRQKSMPWLSKAAEDVLSGQSRVWQELLKVSRNSVDGLEELAAKSKAIEVDIPPDINKKTLLLDSEILYSCFTKTASSEQHCVADGNYSGTASQIAHQVWRDADNYAWFADSIPSETPLPLPPNGITFLCHFLSTASQDEKKELQLELPTIEQLLSVGDMQVLFLQEAAAKNKAASSSGRLKNELGATLLRSEKESAKIAVLLQQAEELMGIFSVLRQKTLPWLDRAVQEILGGQDGVWMELLKLSQESVNGMEKLIAEVKAVEVAIPPEINRKGLLSAAKELHEHFNSGGTSGRWLFKPEIVRKHGGMIGKVKVDGQDCLSLEPLEKLVAWLTVDQQLNYVWSLWQGRAERSSGVFKFQLVELDEMHKALENVLQLRQSQEQVRKVAEACGVNLRQWTEAVMLELIEDCRAVLAWLDYRQIAAAIEQHHEYLDEFARKSKAHPMAGQLSACIQVRDAASYARLHEELLVLIKKAKRMQTKQQLVAMLAKNAPALAEKLNSGHEPKLWVRRLAELEKAWAWAQASSWLKDVMHIDLAKHGGAARQVKVDGESCLSLSSLEKIFFWLIVEQRLDHVWSIWQGKAERRIGRFNLQLVALDEMHKALENVLWLRQMQQQLRTAAETCRLNLEQWTEAAMLELAEDCRAALARFNQEQISSSINKLQRRFEELSKNSKAHPVTVQLAASIEKRDSTAYARLLGELDVLAKKAKRMQAKQLVVAKLAMPAPALAAKLNSGHEWQLWPQRLAQMEEAWAWAQASSWLKKFLQTDLTALLRQSQRLDDEIQSDLSKLAAEKAWNCCFERMSETHRQYLIAWQLAMKKVGKGTGKNAPSHRRTAQKNLSRCQEAVPAWIMPLHKVYETVNAGSEQFDIIIVDEASQCGPEALPLLQLGKRLIVVGDDKQVSPEAVGIDQTQVQQLMRTWLHDVPHADSFGPDTSLFDHCRIRFKDRISLREHFRCMPEIIRFSSALCYADNPLIPLRRYLPDRLEPLQSVLVDTGYREGEGLRVVNRPEAESVVEKIKQCCMNERYQSKSMGVIVLQGTAQADLIEGLLVEAIGAEEMQKRRIICGNSPSFQGDERDVIFLSMVAAPNARFSSMTGLKYEQRFNVAVSRAKDQLWLFHSVTVNHLGRDCLRRRLLEHFQNPEAGIDRIQGLNIEELQRNAHQADRRTESAPRPFDSWFEMDVALQIAGQGHVVVPQYPFAGRRIDLVIQGSAAQLAVECDGDYWHGPERYAADLARQRQLERCGWQFFRIRECFYYADADKALAPLWPLLERMEIYPQQHRKPEFDAARVADY